MPVLVLALEYSSTIPPTRTLEGEKNTQIPSPKPRLHPCLHQTHACRRRGKENPLTLPPRVTANEATTKEKRIYGRGPYILVKRSQQEPPQQRYRIKFPQQEQKVTQSARTNRELIVEEHLVDSMRKWRIMVEQKAFLVCTRERADNGAGNRSASVIQMGVGPGFWRSTTSILVDGGCRIRLQSVADLLRCTSTRLRCISILYKPSRPSLCKVEQGLCSLLSTGILSLACAYMSYNRYGIRFWHS